MSGIYIHIPFCKQACYYCDFHFSTSLKKKKHVLEALIKELQMRREELQDQTVETIYFGGGTPSLLTNEELQTLIDTVYKYYKVTTNPEVTLEANPDDLTRSRIMALSQTPVNRLSIGIQSFFEDDLRDMNRAHSAQEAVECLEYATQYYDNITIDLIYGIPNMSIERWGENLNKAFHYPINHISSYALTVEPKTALETFIRKGNYPPVDENLALQHFEYLVKATQAKGFIHYETSNFGKPGFFSKHNTSYWAGKSYLGIGPSAHSFHKTVRSWNVANNSKYIGAIQNNTLPKTTEKLSLQDQYNEYIMTGLRTVWGVSLDKIENDFGVTYHAYLIQNAEKFIQKNLLQIEHRNLITTQKGKFLVDGIASELFMI